MSLTDVIEAAQFVVDAEGNRKAVQLDWNTWQSLLQLLESLDQELEETEDARTVRDIEARLAQGQEPVRDWTEFEADLDELSA